MKNKKLLLIVVALVMLLLPSYASASPIYLTLEGTVGSIWDGARLASKGKINVGDVVSYVMKIDSQVTGTTTWNNGRTYNQAGTIFGSLENSLLEGKRFDQRNFGLDFGRQMYFQAGNANSNLYLNDWTDGLSTLQVGTKIDQLYEVGWKSAVHYSRIDLNDVTVTRVADSAPTPVPGGLVLMGCGLGLLGMFKRRFMKV